MNMISKKIIACVFAMFSVQLNPGLGVEKIETSSLKTPGVFAKSFSFNSCGSFFTVCTQKGTAYLCTLKNEKITSVELPKGDIIKQNLSSCFRGDELVHVCYSPNKKFAILQNPKVSHNVQHDMYCLGHDAGINSIGFINNGSNVITVSKDRTAKLWISDNGKKIMTFGGHKNPIFAVYVSPDEKTFTTESDSEVITYELSGKHCVVFTDKNEEYGDDKDYEIFKDRLGLFISMNSVKDEKIKTIIEKAEEAEKEEQEGQAVFFTSACVRPGGKYLITGNLEGEITLWRIYETMDID